MVRVLIILTLVIAGTAALCYCQDESIKKEIITIEGFVSGINRMGPTITIRWHQTTGLIGMQKAIFRVTSDVEITRGGKSIVLSDLNRGNEVTIKYYEDPSGEEHLTSIDAKKVFGYGSERIGNR